MAHRLWYRQPAAHWEEGLPLGNGRIGAMELGGAKTARIALNEETLWSGYPADTNRPGAAAFYPEARRLALAGRLNEAQTMIEKEMLGGFTQSYLPLGDLLLEHTDESSAEYGYRELSLRDGVHRTEYRIGGVGFRRETFASYPAQALFVRITADRPGALNLRVALQSQLRHSVSIDKGLLTLDVLAPSQVVPSYLDCDDPVRYFDTPEKRGMRCRAQVHAVVNGGRLTAENGALIATGADMLEIRLVTRTSFNGDRNQPWQNGRDEKALCEKDWEALTGMGWEQALRAHIADHRALYDRVEFTLGDDRDDRPTDERLYEPKAEDQGLFALLFHYGRYLLIASSRPGGQPANLQGIWNQDLRAIWSCNFTLNINLEMNYWAAEQVALPELCEPLFDLVDGLCQTGRETARVHYAARGAVAHHNTDLWRLTNPVGEQYKGFAGCAFWPMALGWLCRSLMEHWRYQEDPAFLRDRALPVLRDAIRFYLDVATTDGDGYLTVAPATSPENVFTYEGKTCKVARRATMTTEILRELFGSYLEALETLKITEPMADEVRAALIGLAPRQTGPEGQMLEWEQPYPEPEPRHRHVSHLYGLYPGHAIRPGTPDAEACRRSLLLRGDDGTGWSLAWKTALWARLGDGDHALTLLRRQLKPVAAGTECNLSDGGSYCSLLDAHPPFQIDGNFGSCAAIAEMLAQADRNEIALLPALPEAWRNGEVRGLRAPHGTVVSFAFRDGRVTGATVTRKTPVVLTLRINGETIRLDENAPLCYVYPGKV